MSDTPGPAIIAVTLGGVVLALAVDTRGAPPAPGKERLVETTSNAGLRDAARHQLTARGDLPGSSKSTLFPTVTISAGLAIAANL